MVERRLSARAAAALVFLWAASAATVAGAADLQMNLAEDLTAPGGTSLEVLGEGAERAPFGAWPATLVFRNAAGGGCTATMVGQRAVLTAAHCIEDGAAGHVVHQGTRNRLVCSHHPAYPRDISADFALCIAAADLGDMPFEWLNTEPATLSMGKSITLLGYGCLTSGGEDRNFGTLYQGVAEIAEMPGPDIYYLARGGAAVCFGDSGGGSFLATDEPNERRLFAVNSRGDISRYSWLSGTANPLFVDWARAWAGTHDVKICGLHDEAQGCRGS
ncbi:MAG: trypsin-like serine protease [Sneathiellaceae bacterium]